MSVKDEVTQSEHVAGNGRKRAGARHCKRFWWLYLAIFVVIVLLVVLLIIFVAVPKIAQSKINAAQLTVQGISITQTQTNSYVLGINSTIESDGSVHATVDGFQGYLYLEDLQPHTPFCTVDFPGTDSTALQLINVSTPVQIQDFGAFTTFGSWLLNNETLRVTMTGNTHVHVSGLSKAYPVTFTKTLTLNGLNKFSGLNVTQASISTLPDANGDDFNGTVYIPNPSIFTMEIGNATFNSYLNDTVIGTVNMDNLILLPGSNMAQMRANISQAPVLAAITAQPYCQTGILPLQLVGTNVTNNGQYIPYFAEALAATNQTTDVNIGAAIKQSLNFTIQCTS